MDFTTIKTNLQQLGYKVSCFDTAAEAADYLDSKIDGTTVGFGGSVTIGQMGLEEKLSAHNKVIWHHNIPKGQPTRDVRLEAARAQVYISSVNGIAETGEIINIDATGNRVAAITYGPEQIFLVAGENKIAPDYEAALWRARNIASPKNAQRLGANTPCAVNADKCYDCKSPGRICRNLSVFWSAPVASNIEVILIHEELGY